MSRPSVGLNVVPVLLILLLDTTGLLQSLGVLVDQMAENAANNPYL